MGGENTESYSDEISNYEELCKGASVPTYRKYTIGIPEAAGYYGIGEKNSGKLLPKIQWEIFILKSAENC